MIDNVKILKKGIWDARFLASQMTDNVKILKKESSPPVTGLMLELIIKMESLATATISGQSIYTNIARFLCHLAFHVYCHTQFVLQKTF